MVHGNSTVSLWTNRRLSEFSNALQNQTKTFCNILGRWVLSRFFKATSEKAEAFSLDPNASTWAEKAN